MSADVVSEIVGITPPDWMLEQAAAYKYTAQEISEMLNIPEEIVHQVRALLEEPASVESCGVVPACARSERRRR